MVMRTSRVGIHLDDGDALVPRLVGHKAATLARLRMAGFDVPEGLVLPVGGTDLEAVASEADARWPGPLAVRTSATWEDTATSARAGETLTVLDVVGAGALVDAIRSCLSEARHLDLGGQGVAVLVQPMLAPTHAGVAFTADPVTGERDVVRIAAAAGVGAALMAGEVDGIDVVVRRTGIDGDLNGFPTAHALAVADTAERVALLLAGPQDVEWAVVDGQVWVLQARPITVLPQPPELPAGGGWQKDVAHYSEPLTPFGWAALHESFAQVPSVFADAGVLIDGLEEVLVGGEVYSRARPAIGSADPGPVPPPPARVLGLLARVLPPLRTRAANAARLIADGAGQGWIAEWEASRDAFAKRAAGLRRVDLSALNTAGLVSHLEDLRALALDGTVTHFKVVIPYILSLHDLHQRVVHLEGWDETDTAALLAGESPATTESESAMAEIRDRLAANPAALAAVAEALRDPVGALARVEPALAEELAEWIEEHGWRALNYDAGTPVLAERPSLVARVLLAGPSERAVRADANGVRQRLAPADRDGFDRALAVARSRYPLREDTVILAGDVPLGLTRRWLVEVGRRLVTEGVIGRGEDAAYLEPDQLVAALCGTAEVAALRADVVQRRSEEAWVRGRPGPLTVGRQSAPPDVTGLPGPFRKVNEAVLWFVGLEYPDHGAAVAGAEGEVLLRGVAGAPGVAEGPVRIVRDHRDLNRLLAGEVLVSQATSPAWVPLFPLAAAVVTDGGGALSHAAIAAREHGLPAVLATQTGTRDLRDGQLVRVDGTTGTVTAVGG